MIMALKTVETMGKVSQLLFEKNIPRGILSPERVQVSKRHYEEAVALLSNFDIIIEVKD